MIPGWLEYDVWSLVLGMGAGLACGFLNTAASSGSAVSLPILMMIGLDPISANATNRVCMVAGMAVMRAADMDRGIATASDFSPLWNS